MTEKKGNKRYLWVTVLAIVGIFLGTCGGVAVGGLAGYLIGRRVAQEASVSRLQVRPEILRRFRFSVPSPRLPKPDFEVPEGPVGPGGALVVEVFEDEPADRAGLREGDLIVRVDDRPVMPGLDLGRLISVYEPGDRIELAIDRQGEELSVRLTLGENPDDRDTPYVGIRYETVFSRRIEIPFRRHSD